jgi:hypothetical protein
MRNESWTDRCGRGGMIHCGVAALVMPSAHITTARHLLAAFHLCRSHRGIWQTSQNGRKSPEASQKKNDNAAANHKLMIRGSGKARKGKLDASRERIRLPQE